MSMRPAAASTLMMLFLSASAATAYNYYENHGHNYIVMENQGDDSYDTEVYAPVALDMGRTYQVVRNYYNSYGWDGETRALNAIELLMEEAADSGISFANVRSELVGMSDEDLMNGPEVNDDFVIVAGAVRDEGIHLIAGGFHNGFKGDAFSHNEHLIDYLHDYSEEFHGQCPGDFLGVFGFDAPDGRFEGPGGDVCQFNKPWLQMVVDNSNDSRLMISDDILPFGTFLDRWDTSDSQINFYETTIPLFCGTLDFPVYDIYPCRYPGDVQGNADFPDQLEYNSIIGSTDLLPSDDVHYGAYTGQDEIFLVDDDGYFRVFGFTDVTSHTDPLDITELYSDELPASLKAIPPVWGASDFRTMDIGDRSTGEHLMNGVVVVANAASANDNVVYVYDDDAEDLICIEDGISLPSIGFQRIELICVGQMNYPVHHPKFSDRRGSIIGQSEPVILVCSKYKVGMVTKYKVSLFGIRGDNIIALNQTPLSLEGFLPDGAVWGIFWPTRWWWHSTTSDDQSGFVLYQDDGSYLVVYEELGGIVPAPVWQVSQSYDNLFETDETLFVTRRNYGHAPYACGQDYLCRLAPEQSEDDEFRFEHANGLDDDGPGNLPSEGLAGVVTSAASELPDPFEYEDITGASSWRPYSGYYDDALLISLLRVDDKTVVWSSKELPYSEDDAVQVSWELLDEIDAESDVLLTSARVHSVRESYRVPLVHHPTFSFPDQLTLLRSDIEVEEDDGAAFADYPVAIERVFDLGIAGTDRNNCHVPNIRCEGRRQDGQLTYYPPADTLLYLMTTNLVHGSRGLHIRMLSMSLSAGNGGDQVPIGSFRYPDLLLNWGPGVDDDNVDMLSRVYGVVDALTGGAGGPDFVGTLVDEDWYVLSDSYARNGHWEKDHFIEDPDNTDLNFLVLQNDESWDLRMLVVNDSDEELDEFDIIYFTNHFSDDYDVSHIAGFECLEDTLPTSVVYLSFDGMEPFTASLYQMDYTGP